ncbi:MAG TPA: hypothetical protein VMX38_15915 [Verrucomicrobiae bacterium]|jgi:hypothetical protein|nr:hypothetical protein [Verrucomicrobiae bacterium]
MTSLRAASAVLVMVSALAVFSAGQEQSPAAPPAADPAASAAKPETKLDLTPDSNGRLSQEQMQSLLRVVADKDMENDKLLRDYTYTEHDIQKTLNGKGQTKSTETKTYDVLEIYGEQVQKLIAKDDKPLDEKDAAKEDEKIQKIIDKRKNESDEDRKKREAKEEKEHEDDRAFIRDVADAYNFTLVGTESLNGREAWVIDGEPRPDFVPHAKDAKYLTKFHGRVWIDQSDLQLAKLNVEALDNISWGLFLARFHKGSHFMLEQTRVNDEVWLPLHVTYKIDARLALLKGIDVDGEQTFQDYKKFRTSSKIVSVQAVPSSQ